MKRKMKKFADGGPTDYSESGSAGGSSISFGDAFKAARKQGLDEFTWRGKKYTTEMAEDKSSKKTESEDEETGTRGGPTGRRGPRTPTVTVTAKRDKPKLPSDRATGYRSQVEETGMSPEERRDAVRDVAIGAATMLPAGRAASALRGAASMGRAGEVGVRGAALAERERSAAAASQYAERMKRMKETAEARGKLSRGATYKRGGSVKRYAAGGSVSSASRRADGIASKGKTRCKIV